MTSFYKKRKTGLKWINRVLNTFPITMPLTQSTNKFSYAVIPKYVTCFLQTQNHNDSNSLIHFMECFISITPENVRKSLVF